MRVGNFFRPAKAPVPRSRSAQKSMTSESTLRTDIKFVFAGVAVTDYAASLEWYGRLLGRPPDVIVKEDEAMWQVAGAGWLYVVHDPSRAGKALVTMLVDDLPKHVAGLAQRGIVAGPMETEPGKFRRVEIAEPDGNMIAIGEDLSSDAS